MRIGIQDDSFGQREEICRRINELMAADKKEYIRKCRQCGRFFTFPSTLQHYPNYCSNCRKEHQAAMKSKYGNPVKRTKNG
jgi:hypothetical protein